MRVNEEKRMVAIIDYPKTDLMPKNCTVGTSFTQFFQKK